MSGRGSVVIAFLAAAAVSSAAEPPFSTSVGRYRLQSNPWVNLHQRLMHESRFDSPSPAILAGEDLARWKAAVEGHAKLRNRRNPIFDRDLIALNAALSAATGDTLPDAVPRAYAAVLAKAMPVYRERVWSDDDRANRFWIAVARPLLESAAEDLAAAHTKVYGVPFPTKILVDVAPLAWEFGAYTVGEGDSAHAVISSTDPGYQGFSALEMLLHEPSHAIVGTDSGAIGGDLTRAAAQLGVKPPPNLWHALLFYTSGELARQWLARHGVGNYQPHVRNMYDRGYRGFQTALESHWQAVLDGRMPREEAIRRILAEVSARNP
ncbi:MAG TPA: hypothetical protein VFM29_00210 [Vicinamibacteria bacterium]|nr:hypothetical protein [Vicinamibacteria bacterium]